MPDAGRRLGQFLGELLHKGTPSSGANRSQVSERGGPVAMTESTGADVNVKVVGLGGAGGNAVLRMANRRLHALDYLAINTDVQALRNMKAVPTLAIGHTTTGGMGCGGNPDIGRKAMRESQEQVAQLLEGSDMVFIAAGMGGGTGTGAAPAVADVARRQGALTVAVVTRPFSFEGSRRMEVAERGLHLLRQKVDTLIVVENDRLLSSLDGEISLEKGFRLADEVLRQGVQGISEIITAPGLINVDFADVKAVMVNGGSSFMALGEGKGKNAASDAVRAALSNPLFDAPLEGATGILFNIKGGKDLTLGQVTEVADIIRDASQSQAHVVFGVVQDPKWNKRVSITLVATGLSPKRETPDETEVATVLSRAHQIPTPAPRAATNGHNALASANIPKLL